MSTSRGFSRACREIPHHERLNGSGYARGLGGEEAFLEACIPAVADVIEAAKTCIGLSAHRDFALSE